MTEPKQWGNDKEFIMSCIAMSVGFGNVWRFPFTAYENGGGAFLIPYIIILIVVGKPFYFLEMLLGQFSGRSGIRVWEICPAFKGVGCAQCICLLALSSYYCSLMALTLFYLVASFQSELPWATCKPEWGSLCVDSQSAGTNGIDRNSSYKRSAELYFYKEVLKEKEDITDGLGPPNWQLALCLLGSWISVYLVIVRGIKSSGKASYFLAIFPYVVMIGLLIRAVTLQGASTGILYFITPTWSRLLEPSVWYNAVAQCFFSLTICFSTVVMFASHNKFDHNVYKDAIIVTTLDTCTSLLAGFTIFGILGNLSYELGINDVSLVARGDTGLAFISYPEAIAKFTVIPQFFAVIFFVMLFVLGIGSESGLLSALIDIIHEELPSWKRWKIVTGVCIIHFFVGLIYTTPASQYMVTFVDYYATSFIAFVPATCEVIAISWGYGLQNFMTDVEFMLKRRLSLYWMCCWKFVTPAITAVIFIYTVVNLKALTYNGKTYPDAAYVIGWIIFSIAMLQIPLWMLVAIYKKRKYPFAEMIKRAMEPSASWGPRNPEFRNKWIEFRESREKSTNEIVGSKSNLV